MVFRRHKGIFQAVVALLIVGGIVRYCYKYHQETSIKLKASNVRHHELLEERNSISRELEVANQNIANLEYSLKSKELELSKSKKECQSAKNDLENRVNKVQSQSLARFNALDSEHRMLKADKVDLETEHKYLQQKFERLKEDHGKIKSTYDKNYKELKDKNEKVITVLQGQVERYQKQEQSLRLKMDKMKQTVEKYKKAIERLMRRQPKNVAETVQVVRDKQDNTEFGNKENVAEKLTKRHVPVRQRKRKVIKDTNPEEEHEKKELKKPDNESEEPTTNSENFPKSYEDVIIVPTIRKETVKTENKKIEDESEQGNDRQKTVEGENKKVVEQKNDEEKETVEDKDSDEERNLKQKEEALVKDEDDKEEIPFGNVFNGENDKLNNDQKFDDHDAALQEGEENEDNAGEGQDKNDAIEQENPV